MTKPRNAARLNPDGTDQDDWGDHWDKYGDASLANPANVYRHAMVLKLLADVEPGSTLLDIGSGQGQFAIDYQRANPGVTVFGVEYSAEGVRRSVDRARILGVPARFIQRDLLHPVRRAADQPLATHAVCSEVLEHVEDPATLLRNATTMLAPGAKVVITVPGGPRSAFDRHIGHFRHFSSTDLREVLVAAGLRVEVVLRSGFPFFNLYKLAVIARGEKLVTEMATRSSEAAPSPLERAATRFFSSGFRRNLDDFPIGWQLVAVAYVPAVDRAC